MVNLENADWDSTSGRRRIYLSFAREELVPNEDIFSDFEFFILVPKGYNYAFQYNTGENVKFRVYEKGANEPKKEGEINNNEIVRKMLDEKRNLGKDIGGPIDSAPEVFCYDKESDSYQGLSLLDKKTHSLAEQLISFTKLE